MSNIIRAMDLKVPREASLNTHSCMHRFRRGHIGSLLLHQHQIPRGLVGVGSIVDQEGLGASNLPALSWSTDTLVLRVLR